MKKFLDSLLNIIIIVLSISTVTIMVVILSGSVYHLYKGSDTLIAGIIAFIGAIIGGTITLFGVNKTIHHNLKINKQEKVPLKLKNVAKILLILNELRNNYDTIKQPIFIQPNEIHENAIRIINNDDLVILAADIDMNIYKIISNLSIKLLEFKVEYNQGSMKLSVISDDFNRYEEELKIQFNYYKKCKNEIEKITKYCKDKELELMKSLELFN